MTTEAVSNERAPSFYVTGGTLQLGARSYVVRQADHNLLDALREGQLCYMLTSRQMGKSSLMVRAATRLRAEKYHVAVIDLTEIGQNLSVEQWYYGLLRRLAEQIELEDDLVDFWRENKDIGPMQRWMAAIREVALKKLVGNIVIFIDEIDAVLSLGFSTDEFFAGIRECYNHRTQEPELERLTFCLLGVATPSDLIQDPRTTPFNIGRRIELADFTFEEAAPLAEGLDEEAVKGKRLLRRVLSWTGGQPYLTQRLCRALSECRGSLTPHDVDKQCDELFLSRKARETDDNLAFVRNRLLRSSADIAALLDIYARARNRLLAMRYDPTNPNMAIVRLSGIVRVVNGRLYVRNQIYFRVFDREWIRTNMPDAELRRQRMAFWRGMALAASLLSIFFIVLGSSFLTTRSAKQLAENEKKIAVSAKKVAETEKQNALTAEERAKALLYYADINLAQREYEDLNIEHVREILDEEQGNPEAGFELGYLQQQCDSSFGTIAAHKKYIAGIALSPDGKWLLTGSKDHSVKLWDALTRQLKQTFTTSQNVSVVALTPQGARLATEDINGELALWNVEGPTPRLLAQQEEAVSCLAYSPDGRWFAAANSDGVVNIWEAGTGKRLYALNTNLPDVSALAFLPDGSRLLIGTVKGAVQVWEVATQRRSATLQSGSASNLNCLTASPDGKWIAGGYRDKTAHIFNARTGAEPMAFLRMRHRSPVMCLTFSRDSKWLATGSDKGVARIWDVGTHRELRQFPGHTNRVTGVAFSPDGMRLYSSGGDGLVKIWDAVQDRHVHTLIGHKASIHSLAFSPDGNWLVTGSDDTLARLWNVKTRKCAFLLHGHTEPIEKVAFSPDGKRVATGSDDGTAILWDVASGKRRFTLRIGDGPVFAVAYSPDGKYLASAGRSGNVRLWEPQTGKFLRTLGKTGDYPSSLAFSPDSRRLLCGTQDNLATLYDVASGEMRVLKGHTGHVSSVAFSADGKRMATGSDDGTAILWDADTGMELLPPLQNGVPVEGVAFCPIGRRLLTGDSDGHAKLWDTRRGQEALMLNAHDESVLCVAFSPDGRHIATGSADATVKIWDGGREKSSAVPTTEQRQITGK